MRYVVILIALLMVIMPVAAQDGTGYEAAMLPDYVADLDTFPHAPRYTMTINLDLGADQATFSGLQSVTYTNQSSDTLNEVVFRLYPNYESYGGVLTVNRVQIAGSPITPTYDATNSVMRVPLAEPLAPDASVTIDLAYTTIVVNERVRLYGQFSYSNGVLATPNFFPQLSVYETGAGWWEYAVQPQGDAVYSETSFFDVQVTAASDVVVVTSGSRVDDTTNADGSRTVRYMAPLMRDFSLMASSAFETISDTQDGIQIDVHYLPSGTRGADAVLAYAKVAVQTFNELFGPYPFAELDIVETYTNAGGIEYPGLIVVQDDAWNSLDTFLEVVVVHEVAHQWWYSLVGNDQTAYPWMDEALAQYATALYYGKAYGPTADDAVFASYQGSWQRYLNDYRDLPIGGPVTDYPDNAYYYIVYQKGPLFFKTLADTYGEAALHAALNDYFMAYRYEVATPADMQASFEASLGADLDALFTEWVG